MTALYLAIPILGGLFMVARGIGLRRKFQRVPIVLVEPTDSGSVSQADRMPDQFTFTDVTDVLTSTLTTSNTVPIIGLGVTVTVTVSGAASSEFQKNGGAWIATPSTAETGDTFAVRHISSDSTLTDTSTTLSVGDLSDTFTSRTAAPIGSSAGESAGLLLAITKAS